MIIISCPGGYVTGGTELLHQLGYKLNLFGFDAYIMYYGTDDGKPAMHPYFSRYNVPTVDSVEDSPENILVFPEMMALSILDIKKRFPLSKHVLWWLSVDNAQMTESAEHRFSEDNDIIHLVQSYYAMDYVKNTLSVPDDRVFYLSDYINYNYLNIDVHNTRDNTVLFNPRKGFERTASIIGSSDFLRIKWRELAGIPPEKVPDVLRSAKVYIDFGNHPGKDRFPREAAACGCRIITGKRGSAAFDRDVPIPERFKIDDESDNKVILEQIYSLVDNYEETETLYDEYIEMIHEEFHVFEADTFKVFSKLADKRADANEYDQPSLKNYIIDAVGNEEYKKALYYITMYRIKEFDLDEDFLILEGYTRIGLSEEQVALYLMNMLLNKNNSNYEAQLIKARALITLGKEEARSALDLALKYSTGTEDEEYIKNSVETLGSMI